MARPASLIPTEDEEQITFCDYLTARGIMFYHPPAEMYTTSWKQKARNKRMGATRGFPDLIIADPKCDRLICIEMKRVIGGVISEYQKQWMESLRKHGVYAFIGRGADMAIYITERLEKVGTIRAEDFENELIKLDAEFIEHFRKIKKTAKKLEELF